MKIILKFCIFFAFFLGACNSNNSLQQEASDIKSHENHFFTLDFKNGNSSLEDFTENFFTTFPHNDPTLGDVVYDSAKWLHDDLIQIREKEGLFAYTKYRQDELGFDSYRLTTKSYYNLNEKTEKILFVFKGSLPSAKGMWPAWWLNGSKESTWTYKDSVPALTDNILDRYSGKGNYYDTPSAVNCTDWPNSGEIDIIENINGEKKVHNTLHTCPQMCDSEWNDDGVIVNCANARPGDVNPGCSGKSYKIEVLEGTFACIWENRSIRFYYWKPGDEVRGKGGPLSARPDPDQWAQGNLKNSVKLLETDAECQAIHQSWQCSNCSESTSCTLLNMKMIFNATLCGVWAGNVFDDTPNAFNNCKEFIRNEGKNGIDDQYTKIEYVSARKL